MKSYMKLAAAAVFSMGAVALTATSAMADIACNAEGECWHVRHHWNWHPEWGVVVHPDGWVWAPTEHYVWREHRGRGYWHNGVWITF
jgi:hypothetical protein